MLCLQAYCGMAIRGSIGTGMIFLAAAWPKGRLAAAFSRQTGLMSLKVTTPIKDFEFPSFFTLLALIGFLILFTALGGVFVDCALLIPAWDPHHLYIDRGYSYKHDPLCVRGPVLSIGYVSE